MLDLIVIVEALVVSALLFVPLERLLPVPDAGRRTLKSWIVDLAHATLGGQAIKTGATVLLALILMGHPQSTLAASLPIWLQVILLLLICDLIIWIVHRACHAMPLLWRFHRIHHSSTRLDWLAASRVHPCEQILMTTAIALPMLTLGFSPAATAIYLGVYEVHAVLLHANTRMSLGPLEAIFTPPRIHHWHHADEPHAYDSNFGSQLVIWDRMFGTAYHPQRRYPKRFGIDAPPEEDFVTHLLAPFKAQPPVAADSASTSQIV